jgi:hypothetical protein
MGRQLEIDSDKEKEMVINLLLAVWLYSLVATYMVVAVYVNLGG